MPRIELMKDHLCDTLMEMCAEQRLDQITATMLIDRAGVARKTFYYHFSDLDDLVSYAAFRPLNSGRHQFFTTDNIRSTWEYCVQHRPFFSQIPLRKTQNNYREAFNRWLRDVVMDLALTEDLAQEEREYRQGCVIVFCAGCVELLMEWLSAGLPEPYDALLDAVHDMVPPFLREAMDSSPTRMDSRPR